MELTERQAFVLGKALVYFLSNLDEYNDCMSECKNNNAYSRAFVTEQEIKEVICKMLNGLPLPPNNQLRRMTNGNR